MPDRGTIPFVPPLFSAGPAIQALYRQLAEDGIVVGDVDTAQSELEEDFA